MARSKRLLAAIAIAFAVPLAFACNAVVGLDDYEKVACTGGKCDGGGVDSPVDVLTKPDSPVTLVDASGTRPVSWAHFRMPNYRDDAGPDANIQAYTAVTGGGFRESISGLTWREPIPENERGGKSWEDAQKICAAAGGGWRLPSRIELVTLLDLTHNPAVDATFATTEQTPYWTTSEVRVANTLPPGPPRRWTVDFGQTPGLGTAEEARGTAGVRCIKAQ